MNINSIFQHVNKLDHQLHVMCKHAVLPVYREKLLLTLKVIQRHVANTNTQTLHQGEGVQRQRGGSPVKYIFL